MGDFQASTEGAASSHKLKGKYKKKNRRHKHQDGPPVPTKNNQSGGATTETHPEEAVRSQSKEIDMPWFRRLIHGVQANGIAAASLFVTVIIAVIYFGQLLSMQDTVRTMAAQTRLSVRPWV